MNIIYHAVFPSIITQVHCKDFDQIQQPLLEWIYEYRKDKKGIQVSNRGGWQSSSDFWKKKSFLRYFEYITLHINESTKFYNCNFEFSNMWININGKDSYNIEHDHPESILSGVFWVKIPDKCGSLIFNSPKNFLESKLLRNMEKNYKKMTNCYEGFNFNPYDGGMILFPSHMRHYVESNESNEERISISFNLK